MIGGVLYLSTPYNRVVALDAATGRELWSYDPKAYADGQPPNGTGFVHRGVAAWRDARRGKLRIFMNSRDRLIALDAETGKPAADFGDNGIVNLVAGLRWETNPKHYTNTSPPVVYKDLVIVGNGVADRLVYKKDPPGDVRAFDARTGKLVWTFHTVPQAGEFGSETWGDGSDTLHRPHQRLGAHDAGRAARAALSAGEHAQQRFLRRRAAGPEPVRANRWSAWTPPPASANGTSRWCITACGITTCPARRCWRPSTVAGGRIDAVVQLTKTGWAFVFDRVTGKPVWPIEERPVPASDVPGEQASPTQPFPTKPPAVRRAGRDARRRLRPDARAEGRSAGGDEEYRLGPLFTPPSLRGTLMRPGIIGGANWGGGALDPETGILYVKSSNTPAIARLKKVETPSPESWKPHTWAYRSAPPFTMGCR